MKKILIVDDTRTVHNFIKSITKDEDLSFSHAFNGKEALELIKKEELDLVLLDWEMPVMNGPETLKEIVAQHPDLPVIMMTTKNSYENVRDMMDMGACEYIMKPFTKDVFMEKILAADAEEEFGYAS